MTTLISPTGRPSVAKRIIMPVNIPLTDFGRYTQSIRLKNGQKVDLTLDPDNFKLASNIEAVTTENHIAYRWVDDEGQLWDEDDLTLAEHL